MSNAKKALILVVVLILVFFSGWFANYFLATPKIITNETEKIVIKYLKGDKIRIGADGSIEANGNASLLDSDTERKKEEIKTNMSSTLAMFGPSVSLKGIEGWGGGVQHDFVGRFGLYAGGEYIKGNDAEKIPSSFFFPVRLTIRF